MIVALTIANYCYAQSKHNGEQQMLVKQIYEILKQAELVKTLEEYSTQ